MNNTEHHRISLLRAKAALRREAKEERVERKIRLDIAALRKERKVRAVRRVTKVKARLKAVGFKRRRVKTYFKQQKMGVRETKHLALITKASHLPIDVWATLETWESTLFDHLQTRIEGIIKRQHRRGYIKWALRLHFDKQDIGGEIINVDGYLSTVYSGWNKNTKYMVEMLLINLFQVGQASLTDYALHFDIFSVVGLKRAKRLK